MILMDCNNAVLGNILYMTKNILNIIWLVGPLLAIVSLTINFITLVKDPEDKKAPKKIKNSVIALVVLFMVPTIVNVVLGLMGNSTEFSACWTQDISKPDASVEYIDPYSDERKSVISDPSGYAPGNKKKNDDSSNITDMEVTACGNLQYCNKFLTIMYNNSKRLNEAIIRNNAPVTYDYGKSKKTWTAAIKTAEKGQLVATTCVVPTIWGVSETIGKHTVLNSVGAGGFEGYKGKITNYTKQYKFDCTKSVKKAIQEGMILPGDIIGVKAHTFTVYSVDQKNGSARVFDGGHRFTNACQRNRNCSPMLFYSAGSNASMKVCQIIRWVK